MKNNFFKEYNKRLVTTIAFTVGIAIVGFALLFFLFDTAFNGLFVDFLAKYHFEFLDYILNYIMFNKFQIFTIGVSVIVIITWYISQRKISRHLADIINSIDIVINKDETMIELPSYFKDIENKLNKIKYENIKNIRLAKEAEQRKNDLVIYLAHDLKTPLTSIIGYLNLLHDEQNVSEELRQKYLSISLDKTLRLEDLINEFFEITRFNLQNITLEKSSINLSLMLEQLVEEMHPQFIGKDMACMLELIPNIYIDGDSDKLARVFDNLLKNAISYSFRSSKIMITTEKITSGVNITVRNSGNQIPPHKLDSIFEKFYRIDSARTSKTGGAGLGLCIAKEIVELHGGNIRAESNESFTLFIVFLPDKT